MTARLTESGRRHLEAAVRHLPTTCRYHGNRILDTKRIGGTHVVAWGSGYASPCCDTGAGAFLRYFASRALGLPTIDVEER